MVETIDKSLQYEYNPRVISDSELNRLHDHLVKFGDLSGVVYCRNNKAYVGGNQRSKLFDGSQIEIIKEFETPQEDKTIAIGFILWNERKYTYREVSFSEEEFREACIAANKDGGSWDNEVLKEHWDQEQLKSWGFDNLPFFTDEIENDLSQPKAGSLKDRFIIPPFSVLDTKLGNWLDRKRAWLSLGIKSDVGREAELTFAKSAQTPHIYEVRNKMRASLGYDPSWDEITEYCQQNNIPMMEGTSIFDPVLCELAYRWFNIPNGKILDPFSGGSVRGIVAAKLDMFYNGVDLRQEQIEANYKNFDEIFKEPITNKPYWVCDDSLNVKDLFYTEKFDLIFSCPPYADLEVYSDDPRDLSNMDYEKFVEAYRTIIERSCELLNDNSFAVFVVGEVRAKNGAYLHFVQDTISAFKDAGLAYYNEMILVNQIGSLAMRATKQFNNSRKIGKHHQNVLVFYKGDLKEIKNKYLELDFTDDDLFQESFQNS